MHDNLLPCGNLFVCLYYNTGLILAVSVCLQNSVHIRKLYCHEFLIGQR